MVVISGLTAMRRRCSWNCPPLRTRLLLGQLREDSDDEASKVISVLALTRSDTGHCSLRSAIEPPEGRVLFSEPTGSPDPGELQPNEIDGWAIEGLVVLNGHFVNHDDCETPPPWCTACSADTAKGSPTCRGLRTPRRTARLQGGG